jgi:hypothetical protein
MDGFVDVATFEAFGGSAADYGVMWEQPSSKEARTAPSPARGQRRSLPFAQAAAPVHRNPKALGSARSLAAMNADERQNYEKQTNAKTFA